MTIRLLTPRNLFPSPPTCHSARRASLPEVAESTVKNAKENLLHGEKVPLRANEGWGNALFLPSPTVCDGTPSLRGRGLFFGWWILRLRPVAARRMTESPELSRFQMEMEAVLSLILLKQIFLTWYYQFLSRTQIRTEEYIIAHFPSSCAQGYRICPGMQHLSIV